MYETGIIMSYDVYCSDPPGKYTHLHQILLENPVYHYITYFRTQRTRTRLKLSLRLRCGTEDDLQYGFRALNARLHLGHLEAHGYCQSSLHTSIIAQIHSLSNQKPSPLLPGNLLVQNHAYPLSTRNPPNSLPHLSPKCDLYLSSRSNGSRLPQSYLLTAYRKAWYTRYCEGHSSNVLLLIHGQLWPVQL